ELLGHQELGCELVGLELAVVRVLVVPVVHVAAGALPHCLHAPMKLEVAELVRDRETGATRIRRVRPDGDDSLVTVDDEPSLRVLELILFHESTALDADLLEVLEMRGASDLKGLEDFLRFQFW